MGSPSTLAANIEKAALKVVPDPVFAAGDQLGFSESVPSKYQQEVRSIFGELTIPLVTSILKIPGLRSLEISVAYRYEEFQNRDQLFGTRASFDNGGTPRISLRYQPIADLTLRASYGQSFLSPSPFDLFGRELQEFPTIFDPLVGGTAEPPNGIFVSGNPRLTPERTDTYTAGLVYTPKFLPGFTTTVDFYQIYTKNVILDPDSFSQIAVTVNGNAGGGPDAPFAEFILREDGPGGPQTGSIISVDAQNQNASKRLVTGMDITATYLWPSQDWGIFTFSTGYNYFFTWKVEPFVGAGTTSFLGDYNNGSLPLAPGAIPYHKGFLRGEWQWKEFDFTSTVNYIGSFNDDSNFAPGGERRRRNGYEPAIRHPSNGSTVHNARYATELCIPDAHCSAGPSCGFVERREGGGNKRRGGPEASSFWQRLLAGTKLTVGVNNVFDRDPPAVLGAFNDNYDTSLYSIRNRYYYISLTKRF